MRIAIYTNILTPYRKYFYDLLWEECKRNKDEFHVLLMAETEPNRNWNYKDLKAEYTILLQGKTFSYGEIYVHANLGLKKALKKLKPDVLICAGSYLCPGIWQAIGWKKKFHYKVLYWSESHLKEERDYGGFKVFVREKLRKTVYRKFDGFWYAGKLSRKFIENYKGVDSSMTFVPNLVDEVKYQRAGKITGEEKDQLRRKYGITPDKVVFICPARLVTIKGIDKFIELMGRCRDKKNATVLVAGDGKLKALIKQKADSYGLDVRLLGFQSQDTIVELYGLSDVFLLPSLSDPNPLSCIEALWAGLPLLISEHCGNYPEVVQNGENGYVFRYRDEKDAIKKLSCLINDGPEWRKKAKLRSLEIAEDTYCSRKVVEHLITYLHRNW